MPLETWMIEPFCRLEILVDDNYHPASMVMRKGGHDNLCVKTLDKNDGLSPFMNYYYYKKKSIIGRRENDIDHVK